MKNYGPAASLVGKIAVKIVLFTLIIGFVVRSVMIGITGTSVLDMSFMQYCGAYLLGMVNDLAFATLSLVFVWAFVLSVGRFKYTKPVGWSILVALVVGTVILKWFCPVLYEFNRGLARVLVWVMVYWTVVFGLRLFLPRMRGGWTRFWLAAILFLYIAIIYLNGVGEYFFWDEFGVRYNFIAVDYLVYTSEVIGNIMESYPMVPLTVVLVAVSGVTAWLLFRRQIQQSNDLYLGGWKLRVTGAYFVGGVLSLWLLSAMSSLQKSDNVYYNELQANGAYRFFDAFLKNRLDYERFYYSLPESQAADLVNNLYDSTGRLERFVAGDSIEHRYNVVLITMESMSADYMEHFGGKPGVTPTLDSLYSRSISFDRMFANGNRTVRGLEALSLSLPPSAGQSLIKRPDLKMRPNVGGILREKGYQTFFFYGGKSYFDNMGPFFKSLGFEIVDKDNFKPGEIEFSHVWGVCDEDSYLKMLSTLDEKSAAGTPFYAQIMTISNHRPYTYPEGRIDIPPTAKSREGGVKYSDYALGRFMAEASTKPWFENTLFVIVADHCASSAGGTELPLDKYHIPAMIYAPGLLEPMTVQHTVSQIDLMPTVLSLLGVGYESTFYGRDVFAPDYTPRAFLATYQDLGYLEGDTLTVLSPVKRVRQYVVKPEPANPLNLEKIEVIDSVQANRAAALYQTSALWND